MKKITPPFFVRYLLLNALFLWGCLAFFRGLFAWFLLREKMPQKAWGLGFRFDAKLVCILLFPMVVLVLCTRQKFFQKKIFKKISRLYFLLIYAGVLFFYTVDAGYFEYLNTRLDSNILRFASDGFSGAVQHLQIVWESYPVIWFLGGVVVFLWGIRKGFKKHYNCYKNTHQKTTRFKNIVWGVVTVLIFSFGIYNSFTHYPLRWSEAFFSKNSQVNHFALNPILYFFESKTDDSNHFDEVATKKYFPAVAKHLNIKNNPLHFSRTVSFKDSTATKPNVVFVMLESFGASVMSYFGNPIHTTPKMDSIANQSVFFTNLFVHKVGTAPSVFASITGLPDVVSGTTASRTPTAIDQRILFDQYKDYQKFYFLGGSANWANIRGVFSSNIEGLQIYEEGSYTQEKRADVWGIDDYELFKQADQILAAQKKPFIAYIQTSSNHMPFTYPAKKESFDALKKGEISDAMMKKSGFRSLKQLNALRYLDFNVSRFLERAKKSGYYDRTIFVFFGDHNTWVNPFDFMKVDEYKLGIHAHHIPAFIHYHRKLAPAKNKKFAKLIDLFPTATYLAKQPHTNYTLGVNLLAEKSDEGAFLYTKLKGEEAIGFLKDGYYFVRSLQSDNSASYPLQKNTPPLTQSQQKSIDSLLRGFYESTRYLYFNNRK